MKTKSNELKYIDIIEPYKLKKTQKFYVFLKLIADFFIGLIGIIILLLPFIIIGIIIKCDSKGPVFFVQKRVGKNGKLFKCIKFRTMTTNANHNLAGYEYSNIENYITKVGKFLRKTSIDELPQIFNLFNGTMSLIGYRPSQDNEYELLKAREGFNMYQIRPGITGWAQVHGRDILAAKPELKAKYDAYYLHHISLWLDIKLFFLTIGAVFKHKDIKEGTM